MTLIKTLASMTKLSEEAPEAEVQQAVAAALVERDTLKAMHSQLAAELGVESGEEMLKAVQSIKAQAETPSPAKFVPFDTYKAMHKELASLKLAQAENEAERLMARARAEGKIIPATEEHFKAMARADPKGFEQLVGVLPDLRPGAGNPGASAPAGAPPAAESTALTETDKAICRAMGISEESYIKANGGK